MSERHKVQDATGVVVTADADVVYYVLSTSTPSASVSGYGVGCLWVVKGGSVGGILFVNIGSATSTTWLAIT